MKYTLLLCFVLLLAQQSHAQGWTTTSVPTVGRYDDLFFLNDALGWACNSQGSVLKTRDGGATWQVYKVNEFSYLRSIEFLDSLTGFCGGLDTDNYLYQTIDGGETWINISEAVPNLNDGICGLSCVGNNVIYGCGVWSSPAYIIKSLDGGASWQKINMFQYASALVDIYFVSQDTGWVSGRAAQNSGGIILHTTNGGLTWQTVANTNIAGDYVWKLQRLDANNWFASIERDPANGAKTNIFKSNNGGLNWELLKVNNLNNRLQAVGFITPEHGWTGDSKLFETLDGGQTWATVPAAQLNGNAFNRFVRINANTAFLTGESINKYSATSSATQPEAAATTAEAHGLSVSPNPAAGKVQIKVELRQRTQVILKVLQAETGAEEAMLWTGEHLPGEYTFDLDLSHKPAGAYVVYLKTHHGAQHVPLVLSP